TNARQVRMHRNSMIPQVGGRADAATKQDLRGAVSAGADNDEVGTQVRGLPGHDGADAEGLPVGDEHPVDYRIRQDHQFATVPHLVQIREGGVPPDAVDDVHRLRTAANLTVEVIEVIGQRDAGGDGRVEKAPLERLDLLGREGAYPKSLPRSC